MRIMPTHCQPPRPAINRQPRRCGLCGAARHFPFDFGWEARIAMGVVGARERSESTRARLAKRGALGGASAIPAPHQSEPLPMAKSRPPKVAQSNTKPSPDPTKKRVTRNERPPEAARAVAPTPTPPIPSSGPSQRATKQNACLRLLARPDGATIEDLQSATGWQSHSVRGFLAGAVKKKLGLTLISSKAEGDVRRYRVVEAGARGQ